MVYRRTNEAYRLFKVTEPTGVKCNLALKTKMSVFLYPKPNPAPFSSSTSYPVAPQTNVFAVYSRVNLIGSFRKSSFISSNNWGSVPARATTLQTSNRVSKTPSVRSPTVDPMVTKIDNFIPEKVN